MNSSRLMSMVTPSCYGFTTSCAIALPHAVARPAYLKGPESLQCQPDLPPGRVLAARSCAAAPHRLRQTATACLYVYWAQSDHIQRNRQCALDAPQCTPPDFQASTARARCGCG